MMTATEIINLKNAGRVQHGNYVTIYSPSFMDKRAENSGANGNVFCQNAFTDIMFKVVNQTEAYLPLFSRVPRYLDGEIIVVWSCSAGTLSLNFIEETFGRGFADAIEVGRAAKVPRSRRFSLHFYVDGTQDAGLQGEHGFNNDKASKDTMQMSLSYCRCDTLSFGIQAGKSYAVNSWQGTAEGVNTELPGVTRPDTL